MSVIVPEAPPQKKKCVACDNEIARELKDTCPVCEKPPDGKRCQTCQKRIPKDAKMCSICRAYQPGWRVVSNLAAVLPVAAIVALVSGIYSAGTYLNDRNSNTRFMVTSADATDLHLMVWNTGKKPSRLTRFQLRFFGQPGIEDATLYLDDGDAVIEPGNPVKVGLSIKQLSRSLKPRSTDEHFTKKEIESWLKNHGQAMIEVEVEIEESGHLWNLTDHPFVQPQRDKLTAGQMSEFILGRIPDVHGK